MASVDNTTRRMKQVRDLDSIDESAELKIVDAMVDMVSKQVEDFEESHQEMMRPLDYYHRLRNKIDYYERKMAKMTKETPGPVPDATVEESESADAQEDNEEFVEKTGNGRNEEEGEEPPMADHEVPEVVGTGMSLSGGQFNLSAQTGTAYNPKKRWREMAQSSVKRHNSCHNSRHTETSPPPKIRQWDVPGDLTKSKSSKSPQSGFARERADPLPKKYNPLLGLLVCDSRSPFGQQIVTNLALLDPFVLSTTIDGTMKRINVNNDRDVFEFRQRCIGEDVFYLVPEKELIFVAQHDGNMRAINPHTGQDLKTVQLKDEEVLSLAHRDNCLLLGCANGSILTMSLRNRYFMDITHSVTIRVQMQREPVMAILPLKDYFSVDSLCVFASSFWPQVVSEATGHCQLTVGKEKVGRLRKPVRSFYGISDKYCVLWLTPSKPGVAYHDAIMIYDQTKDFLEVGRHEYCGPDMVTAIHVSGKDIFVGSFSKSHTSSAVHLLSCPGLRLAWIAYQPRTRIYSMVKLGEDKLLIGCGNGLVITIQVDSDGPHLCENQRCKCNLQMARLSDVDIHDNMVLSSARRRKT